MSLLGRGGMGAVYLGQHVSIGRRVAIKILHPQYASQPAIVQRFFNEARAANLVRHGGIIDVHDFGHSAESGAFLVMEYLEGETLATRLKRLGPMEPSYVARLVCRIASAVGAAHAAGIVHRDLKLDNVFLVPDPDHPGEERTKVLDFGIAKLVDDGRSAGATVTGAVLGTPEYMSPEQCDGAKQVDARTDVYALGVMAYKLLCGRAPFVAAGQGQVLSMQLTAEPPPLRSFRAEVVPALERAIMRALAKAPEARWPRIEDFGRALLEATGTQAVGPAGEPRLPAPETTTAPSEPGVDIHALTTLSAGASAVEPAPVAAARRWRLLKLGPAAAAACVLAGGLAAWFWPEEGPPAADRGASSTSSRDTTVRPTPAPKPAPAPAPATARAPVTSAAILVPAPASAPASVTLEIETRPDHALVYRAADGVLVGRTPWSGSFPAGPGTAVFVVKAKGYLPARVELTTSSNGRVKRDLVRAAAPEKPPRVLPVVD